MHRPTVAWILSLAALASGARADTTFGFLCDFGACGCGAGWLGGWIGATDGYDPDEEAHLVWYYGAGYVGVAYREGVNGWTGPTGYYLVDKRAPLQPHERKTWTPLHFWAGPQHFAATMDIGLLGDDFRPPPADREYTLKLLFVPEGLESEAPPVGTVWYVDPVAPFSLSLPAYWTGGDGRTGYQLEFSMSAETVRGDANCDGVVNFGDIDVFVAALSGREAWEAAAGGAPRCGYLLSCDANGDQSVDFADIDAFVASLSGQ